MIDVFRVNPALMFAFFFLIPLPAIASPSFVACEGDWAFRGRGGEKTTADRIDIWVKGSPVFVYRVIGTLRDKRESHSLKADRISSFNHEIAMAAKAAGGDAVISQVEFPEIIFKITGFDITADKHHALRSGALRNACLRSISEENRLSGSHWLVITYPQLGLPPPHF